MKIKVGVIGASGYAGAELVRLLLGHPDVELAGIASKNYLNQYIYQLYPGLYQNTSLVFEEENEVIKKSDLVFAALPHGLSEEIAGKCVSQNKKFIDLGADFRLEDEQDYLNWYGLSYKQKKLHKSSVYGISEINRELIKNADLIANPGCYPTSIILGSYPAFKYGIVDTDTVIIDSKSGVTGAGKELSEATHFPRTNEAFSPYKVTKHRHTPEIEQALSEFVHKKLSVVFVPHLLPINRGILSTIYLKLHSNITSDEIFKIYNKEYSKERFIRVIEEERAADLKFVQYSNFCDISLHPDERTNTLIIVSCIDNMVKGAAGQAVQNMNIMYGFDEAKGLTMLPASF